MKFGTIVKIGALAAAAASTAAGTVLVTTKALAKVGKMPKEEPIDTSNGPIIKKPLAPADSVPAEPIKPYSAPTPTVEPVVAPEPTPVPAFVTPESAPMPVFTAPDPEPVTFANIPSEPVVAEPVIVDLPDIPAPAPVVEPIPEPTPAPAYTLDYALPYMAGNSDDKTIVTGGIEIPAEEPTLVAEEPIVEVAEELTPVAEENLPVDDFAQSDISEASEEDADQPLNPAPVLEEPIVDVSSVIAPNPAAEQATPVVEEVEPALEEVAPVAEPIVEEPAPAPITFGNLSSTEDYIEAISADEEPAPVEEEAPVVLDKGKEQKIGDAIVSDKPSNPNIAAVASKFGMNADNLVSIEADGNMPMVFEFLYADMKNDATLVAVYFIMNSEATLPPETDKENVLAFGRNFITGNDELKAFLA